MTRILRRLYCHDVGLFVCLLVGIKHDKTKTTEQNDLKLGTVVVLDTMFKPIDFGFKKSRVRGTGSSNRTPFMHVSLEQMQLRSSNFVHKCTTDGNYLRIRNVPERGGCHRN